VYAGTNAGASAESIWQADIIDESHGLIEYMSRLLAMPISSRIFLDY
jgi:hypothetical protein